MQRILAASSIEPSHIALLLGGAALIFSIRNWRRNALRQQNLKQSQPSETSSPLSVREVSAEISALLADLEETARRVAAQIGNRRTNLELLLKEADEKIRRLEALTKSTAPSTSPTNNPAPDPIPDSAPLTTDAAQLISRLRHERTALNPSATPAAAVRPATPAPSEAIAPEPEPEDPTNHPIYQLADQGKSSREIAQALNRHPGEIDLILALRPRQRA